MKYKSIITPNPDLFQSKQNNRFFVAIVKGFIDNKSDFLKEFSNNIDSRHTFLITPIDNVSSDSIEKAYYLNVSHGIDIPIVGEAVLCVQLDLGIFIIDRFSPLAYGVNYDPQFILSSLLKSENGNTDVNLENNYFNRLKLSENKLFNFKSVGRYFLGRNNQYIIFDSNAVLDTTGTKFDKLNDSNFLKIGFKHLDKEHESYDDSMILLSDSKSVLDYFNTKMNGKISKTVTFDESENIGIQTNNLAFIGRETIVIFSEMDIVISALNIILEAQEEINIDAPKINVGLDGNGAILSHELIDMINDITSVIETMVTSQLLTPSGNGTFLPPTITKVRTDLQKLKSQYLNKQSSKMISKTVNIK